MTDILMNQKILNLIFLFSTILVFSQEFSKSDFVKKDWFVDNKNGAFIKSDTLKFIKYSNKALDEKYMKYKEYELKYFGHGYFVELDFKSGGRMNYRFRVDNYATGFDFKNTDGNLIKPHQLFPSFKMEV